MQFINTVPIAYFGPTEYYGLLEKQKYAIEINEYFQKQTLRTRCSIFGANGSIRLTVPKIRKSSDKTLIKDIKISYDFNWQKEHWNSIKSAYRSAPFFEHYCDDIVVFFQKKPTFLIDLNLEIHQKIIELTDLSKDFTTTKNYNTNPKLAFRNYKFNKKDMEKYEQVFSYKLNFIPNLSILDLLFNLGPESHNYLSNINLNNT